MFRHCDKLLCLFIFIASVENRGPAGGAGVDGPARFHRRLGVESRGAEGCGKGVGTQFSLKTSFMVHLCMVNLILCISVLVGLCVMLFCGCTVAAVVQPGGPLRLAFSATCRGAADLSAASRYLFLILTC